MLSGPDIILINTADQSNNPASFRYLSYFRFIKHRGNKDSYTLESAI